RSRSFELILGPGHAALNTGREPPYGNGPILAALLEKRRLPPLLLPRSGGSQYQTSDVPGLPSSGQPPKTLIIKPAATAEPMTPATLGPMACISRKLEGFSFWPTVCATRAAMGTADTP